MLTGVKMANFNVGYVNEQAAKALQPSTTVVPTPGKQGFDVEWHNCGLYSRSHKPVVGKAE